MSMCRVFSCIVGRGCLVWPVGSLGKTLFTFALPHFVLQGQTCLLLEESLDFLFLHSNPMMKRTSFLVLVLKGLVSLHRTIQLQFFSISDQSMDLDYYDIELFALEMNWNHPVIFEIAIKYCLSDPFVDYDSYSISSKGFLPTVVDIMVIWIKFTHSSPF